MKRLSESEEIVMQAIWKEWDGSNPISTCQFKPHLAVQGWSNTVMFTFIRRLEDKGYLRAERSSKNRRENIYFPLITQDEWKENESENIVTKLYGGYTGLFASLLNNSKISSNEIREIQQMINELSEDH